MSAGELKSKVHRIWDTMWSGGISNPRSVIEQLTYGDHRADDQLRRNTHLRHATCVKWGYVHHGIRSTRVYRSEPHHSFCSTRVARAELHHGFCSTRVERAEPHHGFGSTRVECGKPHHGFYSTHVERG